MQVLNPREMKSLRYSSKNDIWESMEWKAESRAYGSIALCGEANRCSISGGLRNGEVLKTVEYTDDGGSTFHSLPDMPEGKKCHSMVTLDGGDIFVAGGVDEKRRERERSREGGREGGRVKSSYNFLSIIGV